MCKRETYGVSPGPMQTFDGVCMISLIHAAAISPFTVFAPRFPCNEQKTVSPELMETIARICVVMNRDFQVRKNNMPRLWVVWRS